MILSADVPIAAVGAMVNRTMTRRRALAALSSLTLIAGLAAAATVVDSADAAPVPSSGAALGFGNNADGEIGNGAAQNAVSSPTAAKLPSGVTAEQVSPGYSHTLALGSDGVVYAWGANGSGQLGNGATTPSLVPTPVSLPAGTTVSSVAAGYLASFAVTSAGKVYAWGSDASGQLGNGAGGGSPTPVLVSLPATVHATAVSAGFGFALAVTSTGAVYAWGYNNAGQLGDATGINRAAPVLTHLPTGVAATAVAAGYAHSLALASSGKVYAWGLNNSGQLGTGSTTSTAVPTQVALPSNTATSIAAGYLHSVAALSNGSAYAWGDNTYGQLGTGAAAADLAQSSTPLPVVLGAGVHVTEVAAGVGHTLLRTDTGTVLAAGDNSVGELGVDDTLSSDTPVPADLPTGTTAIAAATTSTSRTSFVVVPTGIATTTTVTSSTPSATQGQLVTFTATVAPNSGSGTVSFSAGNPAAPLAGCQNLPLTADGHGNAFATCATAGLPVGTTAITATYNAVAPYLDSTGTLAGGQTVTGVVVAAGDGFAWGGNTSGQLGDGTKTSTATPIRMDLPKGNQVVQIAGGYRHGLALLSDGSVYAWGDNSHGDLGNDSTTESDTPVQVSLPAGVVPVSVAAGVATSALVTADGDVYAWGANNAGQLGIGSTTDAQVPTLVSLPSGTVVTSVSLGGAHLLALTSGGAVYAAGSNAFGQLGDNSIAQRTSPVAVHLPTGTQVAGIAAGFVHSLAVTSDGTVLAWGDNSHGELGTGNTTPSPLPIPVSLGVGVAAIAASAGAYDSYALASDGSVLAWGENDRGELGTGDTTEEHTPTAVALPSGTHATAIAAGAASGYALTSDGGVLAWGDDTFGSLGDGSTSAEPTPVPVHLPSGAHAIGLFVGGSGVSGYAIVPQATTTTTVTASANPATAGTSVTFTATVTPGDGGGTVEFTDNGTTIFGCDAVALAGTGPYTATCTTKLARGSHVIVANYSGDGADAPSSGTLAGGETVNGVPTTTKVVTSAATVTFGRPVTFTATVTGSDGFGTVEFDADGVAIAGCETNVLTKVFGGAYQAKCATSSLEPGTRHITATYSGDDISAPSTGAVAKDVLVKAATTLVASPVTITTPGGPATYSATLTRTVDGVPIAGMTVTFTLSASFGASSCSAVTDENGVATCDGAHPTRSGGTYTARFTAVTGYLASSATAKVTF
jgi:alpha-tubulin suppressor-like RCC1 family protein